MKYSDLQQVIEKECRTLAVTLIPSSSASPATIFDADVEATVLASQAVGIWPSEPLLPADFYCVLHQHVAEVLEAARATETTPTLRLVLRGLEALEVKGARLESAVDRILRCTPVAVRIDELAHRIRMFAWRRRLVTKIDQLRAMLVEVAVPDSDIEAALDALVHTGAEQPRAPEART